MSGIVLLTGSSLLSATAADAFNLSLTQDSKQEALKDYLLFLDSFYYEHALHRSEIRGEKLKVLRLMREDNN
tara:strand:- start:781 stop:996 length:216 start_codon:yes stop_codon:yes gene_type:complete